ncbi:hypothetical protein B5S32_g2170 [[Candida] boidinii]|nr:hypothetical protein B5S32_g2170 [[Candida] boidinii]
MASTSQKALQAYRQALRATGICFKARNQLKNKMRLEIDPENSDKSIDERINLLIQVSKFLKSNIVQGEKNGKTTEGKDKYLLNIHKDTELGDNDKIGGKNRRKPTLGDPNSSSQSTSTGGGCCGGTGTIELNQKAPSSAA